MIITLRLISDNISNIAADQEYPNKEDVRGAVLQPKTAILSY